MTSLAATYKSNMNDLRAGRITPDGFRAAVRALRAEHGDAAVDRAKVAAIASSNR